MKNNFWIILIFTVIGCALAFVPSFFNFSRWNYILGILAYVIVLLSLAFFIIKVGEAPEGKADNKQVSTPPTESFLRRCIDRLGLFLKQIKRKCCSVGCALFFCIILIVGIGVFDALMTKDNERQVTPVNNDITIKVDRDSVDSAVTVINNIDSIEHVRLY